MNAALSQNAAVKIFDAVVGTELRTLKRHSDSVTSLQFSDDGQGLYRFTCQQVGDQEWCERTLLACQRHLDRWHGQPGGLLSAGPPPVGPGIHPGRVQHPEVGGQGPGEEIHHGVILQTSLVQRIDENPF